MDRPKIGFFDGEVLWCDLYMIDYHRKRSGSSIGTNIELYYSVFHRILDLKRGWISILVLFFCLYVEKLSNRVVLSLDGIQTLLPV
jgi:hypothetical protein